MALLGMFPMNSYGQDSLQPNILIKLGYGYQLSLFDLVKRYGSQGIISGTIIKKSNRWGCGPSFQYIFGSKVKEDVLVRLRSSEGHLISEDHQLAEVDLRHRGLIFGFSVHREFNLGNGHYLSAGIEPLWMAHWIRFQNSGNTFRPIQGKNRYGYDRMTTGWGATQSLAYRFQSSNRLVNFEIVVNLTEAITRLRRNVQFDGILKEPYRRLDGYSGIQARWIIPIYSKSDPDKIYY